MATDLSSNVKFVNPKVEATARRVRKVFASLPWLGSLGQDELRDSSYHERLIFQALQGIDQKVSNGLLVPLESKD